MRKLMAMVAVVFAATTVIPAYGEDLSQYAGAGWADTPQQEAGSGWADARPHRAASDSCNVQNSSYANVNSTIATNAARVANLSVTPGYNVNARNGLPPTRFDSFVASSGYDDKIYGVYGDSGAYSCWKTIGDGINQSGTASVYGLSTGHQSNLPTLQSDPGVTVRPDSCYNNAIDCQYHGSARM